MHINKHQGVPQKTRWRKKASGSRPVGIQNHLARDFSASEPTTRWVTAITYLATAEGWLYLSAVKDLYSDVIVGWSMSQCQTRELVIQAVLMALWQRQGSVRNPADREHSFWLNVNTFPVVSGITVHVPGITVHNQPESLSTH